METKDRIKQENIMVSGIGCKFLSDEGFGINVIEKLKNSMTFRIRFLLQIAVYRD
ncbi:peptidase domain-containing protein [Desulfonema magnum]|uniref:Peptidase domain-containing protein n=1 Tax=Desulfonema magnum TaxID=45655 RepID=A0A975BXW6_9BACT|nr:peptidase domain-containing protein [Desulfonema magnum]